MVDFCPECSNLLRRTNVNEKNVLACRCGYIQDIETNDSELEKKIQEKKDALKENVIVVSQDDKITVNPTVNMECPKCGHTEAEAWQEQTRSADEPSTSFFRCLKCRNTWREY